MPIYDSIAAALDMTPIQFDFNLSDYGLITSGESMSGSANPMYGQKRPDLIEFNKTRKGSKLSEEHKKKISNSVSGESNPMYGKKHTDEVKKAISELNKGSIGLIGAANPMYGKKGELHHQHGIARSDEVKRKISEANKNQVKIICEHCGLPAVKSNYNRWHGVNCKSANYKT